MESGALKVLDVGLYRRGQLITALARWLSVSLALLSLAFVWNSPRIRPFPALAVALSYLVFNFVSQFWLQRLPARRLVKIVHDVADALAVGLGAGFSGGLESPIWLLLYPHVVAVSVRGGLTYAMAFGVLDAVIVSFLAYLAQQYLGTFHSFAILFCAFMGGTTSSYLHGVQQRLSQLNQELTAANRRLSETVSAQSAARRDQELAMARVQESEERYRLLLGRIQDGVVAIQDGRLVYANEVFAKILEDPESSFLGGGFHELIVPEDRGPVLERYRTWEQSQEVSGTLETRVRTRSGDVLLVAVRATGVEFQGKRAVIATVRDITRERRMEQDVKAHAERLAAINEIANAVNLNLTIEDILAVAADEARRLVPFDRLTIALLGEEEGKALEVVAVGAGTERIRAAFTRDEVAWAFRQPMAWCQGSDEPVPAHVQGLMAHPDVLSVATVPLRSKDRVIGSLNLGRLEALAFTSMDLAVMEPVARHIAIALDNARLLETVRKRSHEFESLLEITRGIVARLNLAELLPLVTRSVNRVMGTSHCILLLRSGDRLRLEAQEGVEPGVVEAFHEMRVGESLSGWVARHGEPLAVPDMRTDPRASHVDVADRYGYRSFLCVPLKRGDEVLGTLEVVTKELRQFSTEEQHLMTAFAHQAAVAIDNARLFEEARSHLATAVEANRRLEDLDRLRREYLRNVSHEFRTPLTVIKGYTEFLMDGPEGGPIQDVLRIMVESCDRVIDLVDTLIDVSRIEQGVFDKILHVQVLDLREVTTSSVEAVRRAAARKLITLNLDFPAHDLGFEGDGSLFSQVVKKLVDNAVKYSPSGGRVEIRCRGEGDEIVLEVEDDGIGIEPEHLPRIWDKFYMADGGIARRAGGTGVGLYLVREIVRLHHGSVTVQSVLGQGSLFSVRLPRRFQAAPPEAALA